MAKDRWILEGREGAAKVEVYVRPKADIRRGFYQIGLLILGGTKEIALPQGAIQRHRKWLYGVQGWYKPFGISFCLPLVRIPTLYTKALLKERGAKNCHYEKMKRFLWLYYFPRETVKNG